MTPKLLSGTKKVRSWLGYTSAMWNVGNFYEIGIGVTKDLNKAKEWYTKAAAQGNVRAQEKLDTLNQ